MILWGWGWGEIFLAGAEDFFDSFIIFEGDVFFMIILLDSSLLPLGIIPYYLRMSCISP